MTPILTESISGPNPPTLVYLDLNKWIDLTRAETDSAERQKYRLVLKSAEQSVSAGEAIFPLSFAHFMEVAKIGAGDRRRRLAKLMVKLSKGFSFPPAAFLCLD